MKSTLIQERLFSSHTLPHNLRVAATKTKLTVKNILGISLPRHGLVHRSEKKKKGRHVHWLESIGWVLACATAVIEGGGVGALIGARHTRGEKKTCPRRLHH